MQLGGFGNFVRQLLGHSGIALGGFVLLVGITAPIYEPEEDYAEVVIGCIVIGLPPATVGVLVLSSSNQTNKQKKASEHAAQQKEINRLFYALIEEGKGSITPLKFASAADISLLEAKTFLDNQAKLLNPEFEATHEGMLIYKFPTGYIDQSEA